MAEKITLPLVPLHGIVVFPNMIMHLDVGREKSVNALEAAMVDNRRIFLVAQNDSPTGSQNDSENDSESDSPEVEEKFFEVGTISEIRQIIKLPDGNVRVLVEGINRGIVHEHRLSDKGNYDVITITPHEDSWDESMEIEALVRGVVRKFEEWVKLSKRIPSETFIAVTILEDFGRLADLIASHLNLKLEAKQEILNALSVDERLEKLYTILTRELEILQMESQINQRVRNQMEKLQKDHYLREQLKAIHKELGEEEDTGEEASEYRKRMDEGDYPDEIREIVGKELSRMSRLPPMASEGNVINVERVDDVITQSYMGDNSGVNLATLDESAFVNLNQGEGLLGGEYVQFGGITKLQGGSTVSTLIGNGGANNTLVAGVGGELALAVQQLLHPVHAHQGRRCQQ